MDLLFKKFPLNWNSTKYVWNVYLGALNSISHGPVFFAQGSLFDS